MKKTGEFRDNESKNISGESIRGAALINLFVPGAAVIRGRRLIEGGACSSKYGMLFAGLEASGSIFKTEVTVFYHTDRPKAGTYLYLFIYFLTLSNQCLSLSLPPEQTRCALQME